jgi:hypothetical protein
MLQVAFFKIAQAGGRTWDLLVFIYFPSQSSALDHSATAPPMLQVVLLMLYEL